MTLLTKTIASDGRHGDDPVYASVIRHRGTLVVGRRYRVQIRVAGRSPAGVPRRSRPATRRST